MKSIIIFAILTGVLCKNRRSTTGNDDLILEIEKAKQRLKTDFILNLWYGVNDAILESQANILKIYTEYTIQQAQHVIEHISLHRNITRSECVEKREKVLSSKNLYKLVPTLQCLFSSEENTLKAYKITGYNLHNCIRMAQNEMEGKYLKIVENLNNIKKIALQAFEHYNKVIDNCAQPSCVLSHLFRSIVDYERLKHETSTNATEVNTISTRYIFSHIAMGCISTSLTQISDNYKIGTGLADNCLLQGNKSEATNATDIAGQTPSPV